MGVIKRLGISWSGLLWAGTLFGLWAASIFADEPNDSLCVLLFWLVFGAWLAVDISRKLRNARPRY